MASKKIQLYTDRDKTIEASPETSANCVILSDGNDLQKVLDNDLTNPTVVHEETSFKVGVGDIDVSSSVVDGEVGHMVIKGKTYQNILPEPSTHVLTNNKEMFKVNEGLDSNVEIVDAVSKSAILKGQTLVNLTTVDGFSNAGGAEVIVTDDGNKIRVESTTDGSRVLTFKLNQQLKSNTKYLFIGRHTKNIANGGDVALSFKQDTSYTKDVVTVLGNNGKTIITTSDASGYTHLVFGNHGSLTSGDSYELYYPILIEYQEGMENWDIPYFEGIQSVKMPVLCTTGKNLFDSSTEIVTGQGISSVNGLPYNISTHSHTGFLRAKPNTSYTITQSHDRTWVFAYDKNKEYIKVVKTDVTSGGSFVTPNDTSYIRLDVNTANVLEIVNGVQIEEGSTATSYEPYKSNILTVNEDVELRGIGEVKDELNLLTGELTQRIGEIVLDGSEDENWHMDMVSNNDTRLNMTFKVGLDNIIDCDFATTGMLCDRFIQVTGSSLWANDVQGVGSSNGSGLKIGIPKSNLTTQDVNGFRYWLSQNPVTVQYQLATESIKTVDLSTSGNWEKIVLDGSEDERWLLNTSSNGTGKFFVLNSTCTPNLPHTTNTNAFCDRYPYVPHTTIDNGGFGFNSSYGLRFHIEEINIYKGATVEDFRQYLQQNPITVWYQTQTHQDSTQVKQPIFFKDGHIQLSSGVDSSLIPTLDYQAKTSNSYVMDLMKTNTKYTMKAKSASGTFTIDGTSYGAGTDGTFTTPSSMTNKLLVMSNKTNEEVMILEGDVTSKTIPYFKGIKSAFEDEGKIEVLSQGKNLIDETLWTKSIIEDGIECLYGDGWYSSSGNVGTPILIPVDIKQGKRYRISVTHKATTHFNNYKILQDCLNNRVVGDAQSVFILDRLNTFTESNASFVANFDAKYLMVDTGNPRCYGYIKKGTLIIEEVERDGVTTAYEPYKSNSTKIPLLSPLRSLPNGVCDELTIDRMKNKATLIQRVGEDLTQLVTPTATEINPDSYPYIYKDGHIFLNSEIAPVVEIDYSVNQSQQIISNGQTILRHQQDIDELDLLIVSFVNAEYNLRLLKFDMELSMMALDE